ncbi:hypothetical protein AB0L22_08780 [Micromonospora haikouensis]|uniref:hypothetical protein n=1 Tax=Micromonospora haikouensis TaxID=686309 RepID=UPI00341BF0A6
MLLNDTNTTLAHGYTLADLHRLARQSAGTNRSMAADHRDLLDTAWSAIAEAIYTAEHWPSEHALLTAGRAAIWRIANSHRTTYGYRNREWDADLASAPRFCAYWLGARVTASPEESIVERVALPAVMAALGEPYRAAIVALATHQGTADARALSGEDCGHCGGPWADHTDRDAATCSLGLTRAAFNRRLQVARRTCLQLWLEHETPHKVPMRHPDRRNDSRPVQPCGTPAAARRHRDRKETLCALCAPVERAYDRDRKARRRQALEAAA